MQQVICNSQTFIKKSLFLIILGFALYSCKSPDHGFTDWTFKTSGRIHSNPIVDNDLIYFGSNDSIFHAIEAESGKEIWKKKTLNTVRSTAIVNESHIYFTSGNDIFGLNKSTGEDIWAYSSTDTSGSGIIDPWDYHQSSPLIYQSVVYAGFGNGLLLGFNQENGKILLVSKVMDHLLSVQHLL